MRLAGDNFDKAILEKLADIWDLYEYLQRGEIERIEIEWHSEFLAEMVLNEGSAKESAYESIREMFDYMNAESIKFQPGDPVKVIKFLNLCLSDSGVDTEDIERALWGDYRSTLEVGIANLRKETLQQLHVAFEGLIVDGPVMDTLKLIVIEEFNQFILRLNRSKLVSISKNVVITGHAGVGKTEIARRLAKVITTLPWKDKSPMIEVRRSDLVAGYVGQTEERTKKIIKKARNGVLIVDEAHELLAGGERSFAKQAIEALGTAAENHRDDLIMIFTGYPDQMGELFTSQPGLASRFPNKISRKDFSINELEVIRDMMLDQLGLLELFRSQGVQATWLENLKADRTSPNFGNARWVRNWVEKYAASRKAGLLDPTVSVKSFLTGPADFVQDPPQNRQLGRGQGH